MATKRAIAEKKKRPPSRPPLVFEAPHVFRVKSERALSHLQESHDFEPCIACLKEANRRQDPFSKPNCSHTRTRHRSTPPPPPHPAQYEQRPSTATKKKRSPPTEADLERLSRPKTAQPQQFSNNCNWNNFINRRSKYAIKTPYAQCDLFHGQENSENRPPFVNYGGRYSDKQTGEKRTFNSLAIHQLKHHEVEEHRLAELVRERHLRLQAQNYRHQIEEQKARAQELRDRAARSLTEYRDNYRPPLEYEGEGTYSRH